MVTDGSRQPGRDRQGGDEQAVPDPAIVGDDRTVLVVDDEPEFAESVGVWVDQYWDAVVANDGRAALDAYGPHVDAVLLDRRMPRLSGDETLAAIRDRPGDARVAMLTALEPDLDVVDLEYDMYLEKPVDREAVVAATAELLRRAEYSRELQALYALSSKVAELEATYDEETLARDDRFQRLTDELQRVREQADADLAAGGDAEFRELLQVVDDAGR